MFEDIRGQMTYELLLALGAFLLAMFLTPIYTYFAYRYKFWKKQKKVAVTGEKLTVMNKLHAEKIRRHFPTMAGVIGVVTVFVVTFICNFSRSQTWLLLAAFVGGGAIGMVDDVINLFGHGKAAGLRAPVKFTIISALGLFLGWFFAEKLGWTGVMVPFFGMIELGWLGMILVFAFAVVATSNAINISDGLDGLAGGLCMLAYGAFGVIALLQEQFGVAGFCFTVVGWLLSYVWFNVYPARFMMGDVGSMALGAGLGAVAMMTNSFFLLPVIGILFVVEAGSSLLQIVSKKSKIIGKFWMKILGRPKPFISAPVHHHLEAKGWVETKVTMRFWVIAGVFAVIGVFMAMGGGIVK